MKQGKESGILLRGRNKIDTNIEMENQWKAFKVVQLPIMFLLTKYLLKNKRAEDLNVRK